MKNVIATVTAIGVFAACEFLLGFISGKAYGRSQAYGEITKDLNTVLKNIGKEESKEPEKGA
ncbi:MAG: hypothetical protein E7576_07080 [Ruminococcaceae bacterium]|nr:hypothetical protein [Oscillospiraceae bacterium]